MKLLIHDLEGDISKFIQSEKDDIEVVADNGEICKCIGCFGCWIKTPGVCTIRDTYGDMGHALSKCSELIVISECFYGGFSPFIKNVFDRSIPYVHPYFEIRNGEMHHKRRYNNQIDFQVIFYGENITEKEKLTAVKLVKANSINLDCKSHKISFIKNLNAMEGLQI